MTLSVAIALPQEALPPAPLSALLILTRDPRGRMSGRKMVLRTIVDSLQALGHRVVVAHFGPAEGPERDGGLRYVALPEAPGWRRALSCARALAFGRRSVNEALYRSAAAERLLDGLVEAGDFDLVVSDMARTADYAARTGLPWIADLDDLLSKRYRLMAASDTSAQNLLGYYRAPGLRWLGRLLARLQPVLLRREARLLARREDEIARQADLVSLVSPTEAAELALRTGRRVAATPMAVPGPSRLPPLRDRPHELVFLGGMDYGPNLNSVRQFDRTIRPALVAIGLGEVGLHVIGHAEPEHRRGLSPAVTFRGYVGDLDAALRDYRAMLVPEVAPGGIKTKIVTAALNGALTLCHRTALDGMGLTDGREVLAWSDAAELAELIAALRQGRIAVEPMAVAAHRWATETFGEARLRQLWAANLATCLDAADGALPAAAARMVRR